MDLPPFRPSSDTRPHIVDSPLTMSFGPKISPTIPHKIRSPTSGFQQFSLTKMFQNGAPGVRVYRSGSRGRLSLSEVERYRQYAKDCVRIASTMSGADRQTLLKIAQAWEGRARQAEANLRGFPKNKTFGPDGRDPPQQER